MRTLGESKVLFLVLVKRVFGVFVNDQVNGGCFLFCWRLMLLCLMRVEFESTCAVSGK